ALTIVHLPAGVIRSLGRVLRDIGPLIGHVRGVFRLPAFYFGVAVLDIDSLATHIGGMYVKAARIVLESPASGCRFVLQSLKVRNQLRFGGRVVGLDARLLQ